MFTESDDFIQCMKLAIDIDGLNLKVVRYFYYETQNKS